ncbi:MAG: 2-oxoglutarate dehydrogenase [Clostridia bacterium]|nr:2-oxoglutarate dehydrogenase [Clostridia bacterium]
MFGRRKDGKKVKNLDIIEKAGVYFMPQRIDAVNLYKQKIDCDKLDQFILEEKKNGVHFTYQDILIASIVRLIYNRPKLNRFIMNCQIYQRNYISVSMNIKKKLSDDGEEVTLKMYFTGRESIYQVKEIVKKEIEKYLIPTEKEKKKNEKIDKNETRKTAGFLCKLPNSAFKFALGLVRFLDKGGNLPKSLIHASPFHTSIYVTNLKSIKLNAIYHHLYNFGTTTMFAALGKEKYEPVTDVTREIRAKKLLEIGFTLDERVADGLYYGNSLRMLQKFMENPVVLKEELKEGTCEIDYIIKDKKIPF